MIHDGRGDVTHGFPGLLTTFWPCREARDSSRPIRCRTLLGPRRAAVDLPWRSGRYAPFHADVVQARGRRPGVAKGAERSQGHRAQPRQRTAGQRDFPSDWDDHPRALGHGRC